ncbi:restriction endonuclease [Halorubrum gandharaense]
MGTKSKEDTSDISLTWSEKREEISKSNPAEIIGVPSVLLYISGALVYFSIFIAIAYLSYGTVQEFRLAMEPSGPSNDISGAIVGYSILAGCLSVATFRTLLLSKHSKESTLVLAIVHPIIHLFTVAFWGFLFIIPSIVVFILLPVPDQLTTGVSVIAGFAFASIWLIGRTHHALPDEFYHTLIQLREGFNSINKYIETSRDYISKGEFEQAIDPIITAYEDLESIKGKIASDSEGQQSLIDIHYLEDQIHQCNKELVSSSIDSGANLLEEEAYEEAYDTLSVAREALKIYKNSTTRIQAPNNSELSDLEDQLESHIEKAQDELRATANTSKTEVEELITEASDLQEKNQYAMASIKLESATEIVDKHQRLATKDILQNDLQSQSTQIQSLRDQMKQDQQESELRSDIDKYREMIANIADESVDKIELNIESKSEIQVTKNEYERLFQTMNIIQRLRDDSPHFPWDVFQSKLNQTATGTEVTRETLIKYHTIATDIDKIVTYLKTAPEDHPSIDSKQWREAISISLEEEYQEILTPIVKQIERLGNEPWQREHLYEITWEEFESLIGELYGGLGFNTEVTKETADLGVDVWAERDGDRTAIQVKQYSETNTVGRETLQKLLSTIARGEANRAVVVTSGDFAYTAKQYAADTPDMELIDGDELLEMLSESEIPPPV